MLSVEECRKHLGVEGAALTDDQIIELRRQMYAVASVLVELRCGPVTPPPELPPLKSRRAKQ